MNRFRGYSKAVGDGALEGRLRALSAQPKADGRARLRLPRGCAANLMGLLRRAGEMDATGDEALRRLQSDVGHIEACLRQARAESGALAPAVQGVPRVLRLARALVNDGEEKLSQDRLLESVQGFDGAGVLRMGELQLLPAALRIALCEGLRDVAQNALSTVRARAAAEEWLRSEGRKKPRPGCDEAFLEHALRLCAEQGNPRLHARVERLIEGCGQRKEWLVERAHRMMADNCLRLDNLMQLRRLLEGLNWQKCFDAISPAEHELRCDPARVYENMDAASREWVRKAVAELADHAHQNELALIRHALQMADQAAAEHGMDDPRATVCWYFAENAGRARLCRVLGVGAPRKIIPDARGGKTVLLLAGLTLALWALFVWIIGTPWLMLLALPLAWVVANRLVGRFYSVVLKPGHILKLKLQSVPENARTLVALPVLLSSPERVREMIAHMEALGCLEKDANVDFLLLGDFRDGSAPHDPQDEEILHAARDGVAGLNSRAEREKYYYLHRERAYRKRDQKWMGENRKRGALTALNFLLLNRENARAAFGAESSCAVQLAGRYRYVVTLDADTEYLPGTIQRLVGAMLHPLNRICELDGRRRGFAVLQPAMQMTVEANQNAYVELTCGSGGMDSYPVSISDFYQDMTGHGNFAGKGIYDLRAFTEATEGKLDDDNILSHDLIEGILSGAGFLNDVQFYDGVPSELRGELTRLHRWTRGDWQLLPVLFSKLKLSAVDRMKLLGNLLRSLYGASLLGLLLNALWMDLSGGFMLGLALAFLDAILCFGRGGAKPWRTALLRLALLPASSACEADAVLRTLWRLAFTKKHMMDWVPAADASGSSHSHLPGRVAALLLLPALLRPYWLPAVLALVGLFWVGAGWAQDLSEQPSDGRTPLNARQLALLNDLAQRTWRFFESYVPENGMPPDNVQFDPDVGAAKRTSPTNIGLYLMSCLAAQKLGFLRREAMLARMSAAVSTMEGLEKWQGQLYNWYDTESLAPLQPRYVSAVDSGNLAGALLLCAQALREEDEALSGRMQALAQGMNLAALYDEGCDLFRIGMDVDSGRLSQSHYDLYASEARILSFSALMLGQIPLRHWKRLSRAAVRVGREQALLSWSGTLFEYLMPELLLHSHPQSLAGQSRRAAVACNRRMGRALNRPWGVSESGYYAFDLQLNYQYRAFGLRDLALCGNAVQDVVAPYAAALALCCDPAAAAENLQAMCDLGWCGPYGLYEAADYLHRNAQNQPRIVRSHMAHHQGMALCALCNALKDDALAKAFMEIPQARALRLLLQEKRGARVRICRQAEPPAPRQRDRTENFARMGRAERSAADAHLLHGGETTALVTARGGAFVWSRGLQLNRFSGDLCNPHEGMFVHLRGEDGQELRMGQAMQVCFDAGVARFQEEFEGLKAEMQLAVSPESGALFQRIEIENPGADAREIEVTGCLAAALASEADMRAHGIFQNLFVESQCRDQRALMLRRRIRTPGEGLPVLAYGVCGGEEPEFESDLERLLGRNGSLGMGGLAREWSGTAGHPLNPCAALRVRVRIAAGETARLHFALGFAEDTEEWMEGVQAPSAADRALQLAATQARAVLGHIGVDGRRFRLYQRAGVFLFDPKLGGAVEACPPAPRNLLWSAGVSGDRPILLVESDGTELSGLREALRLHGFYRMMGVRLDFVLVNLNPADYRQSARGALGDMIASSHLSGSIGMPGGAFVLERASLEDAAYTALNRAAALRFRGDGDVLAQLRGMLDSLLLKDARAWKPMAAEGLPQIQGLQFHNGYGGFEGDAYCICIRNGLLPPAPWSNVLAAEGCGALLTERGGGFIWGENSRSARLTSFANDALREGWGWMFYLLDGAKGEYLRLLPGDVPMTDFDVRFRPGLCSYKGCTDDLRFEVRAFAAQEGICFEIEIENRGEGRRELELACFVDWLMGADAAEGALLRTWSRYGACFASGAAQGVGVLCADDPRACPGCDRMSLLSGGDMMQPQGFDHVDVSCGGWMLRLPLELSAGERHTRRFLLGCAGDVAGAYRLAREFRSGRIAKGDATDWRGMLSRLEFETPDGAVNLLCNGFLQAQTLNARIRGRTGLYQPGGAYGFRDQLQDMLPMLHYQPERVRQHLLRCAARQFEAGDVLHWWHEPYAGVRTRIRDDLLFLPYVAAQYVRVTGDSGVLLEEITFLEDVPIPDGAEDIYAQMQPSSKAASLHEHCMRALHRAAETGEHGLCVMGGGDWNDGMNRVGGESVWLTEFLAAVAADYARICPGEDDATWLMALNERLCAALEARAWDGEWYLRAYAKGGERLGSRESPCCKIDLISQAWAVLAGLDDQRCRMAMDSAWAWLADESHGMIRLLTPPFDGQGIDPGYIAAYPPGIRENGAQYTHAACWMLCALARQGDADRAHKALQMLLPINHSDSPAAAQRYRVEPYAVAADIYTEAQHMGRGGWTWYTGSAAWLLMGLLELLGYERQGNAVRLCALLGDWPEAAVRIRHGHSSYRLICRRSAEAITLDGAPVEGDWISLTDDGQRHEAVFPARESRMEAMACSNENCSKGAKT